MAFSFLIQRYGVEGLKEAPLVGNEGRYVYQRGI